MPNQLPLPESFQHLIEKRDGQDRRSGEAKPEETLTAAEMQEKSITEIKPRRKQRRKR